MVFFGWKAGAHWQWWNSGIFQFFAASIMEYSMGSTDPISSRPSPTVVDDWFGQSQPSWSSSIPCDIDEMRVHLSLRIVACCRNEWNIFFLRDQKGHCTTKNPLFPLFNTKRRRQNFAQLQYVGRIWRKSHYMFLHVRISFHHYETTAWQIGRASCRERVLLMV